MIDRQREREREKERERESAGPQSRSVPMETQPKTQTEIIYRSRLPDIEIPKHLPLHAYCLERLDRVSSRPCLINATTGDILTYADLDHATRRFAAGLHRMGVGKGHVIMLLLPNAPEFIIAFLGASRVGAATTAANPFHTASEIAKHAEAAGAKLLVVQSSSFEKVKDLSHLKIACIDEPPPNSGWMRFAELADSDEREAPEVEISGDDLVALPFSSGTTGLPKGVMLTHKGKVTSIAQQVDGENPNLDFSCEDVMLCVLPLFHIYSLNITLCGLRVGAAIMIMERFETRRLLEMIEKYRVTVAPMVPPIVLTIARSPEVEKYDLSSVRIVQSGAAPLGKELEGSIKAKFPNAKFGQGYGMTEAGPVLAMSLGFAKHPFEVKSGACGTVIRNAEMKIIDPETGVSLARNQPGEICIRGDQIMKGYLKDPVATERTIDKGGWLHTGDVGYMDDDDELFIVDRLKELIKYKGFQVAPAELEAMLINHPQISDAAVVAKKDEEAGEIPVAFVVRSKNSLLTQNEVKQYISEQVVFYKRLKEVFFVEVIPKAPSGKILRKDLRARLATNDIPN